MKPFVLDCSVAMAWCFEDEAAGYADRVLKKFTTREAVVPAIWPLEVANVLLVGERRKRLTKADNSRFLELLQGLPITIDVQATSRAFGDIMSVARSLTISAYDAAYVELAMREGLQLATLDDSLNKAALKNGIKRVK